MINKFKYYAEVCIKTNFTAILAVCVLVISSEHGIAQAQPEASPSQQIDNAGLGFSYTLPSGWEELSPVLMGLYNTSSATFAKGSTSPYLVAGYSNKGTQFLPPALLIHFVEQPVTANMVEPLNNLFLEEARDEEGKTKIAQKLNLASKVRFIEAKELSPGVPLIIAEADATLGFTVRIMSAPFYLSNGTIIVAYFAPLGDYELYENEMLNFFRGVSINPANAPR